MRGFWNKNNLLKKIALVFVLIVTCFTFSACSWWSGGNNNGGGNNGGGNQGGNTGDNTGGYNPGEALSQIPSVKAIAGVYIPELNEISADSIATRDQIYAGVTNAAAGAIILPTVPPIVENETPEQTEARLKAEEAYAKQKAKQNAIKAVVDSFVADNEDGTSNIDKSKYGFFASEVEALITAISVIAETYEISTAEITAVKTAVKNYLTNNKNVPGTPVENETGEYATVLVAPIVEIQVFYVETYEVIYKPVEDSDYSSTINVSYLDDHDKYSTKFEDKEIEADRMILPSRKWLTFYYAITPGAEGFFYFHNTNYVIVFDKDDENAEEIKQTLLNYTAIITAQSDYSKINYADGKSNYSSDFRNFYIPTVEEQLAEIQDQLEGLNDDMVDQIISDLQKNYDTQKELYGEYCQFTIECFDADKAVDERAPKLSKTSVESLIKNNDYSKAIIYVKNKLDANLFSYGIESRAEGIDGIFAINIKTNGAMLVPFGVENLNIGIAQSNKLPSEIGT